MCFPRVPALDALDYSIWIAGVDRRRTALYWSVLVGTGRYWSVLVCTGLCWSVLVGTRREMRPDRKVMGDCR